MNKHITQADLDHKIIILNMKLDRPQNTTDPGCFHTTKQNGAYRLAETCNQHGGVREHSPRCTKSQLALFLDAMIAAIDLHRTK